MKIIMKYFDVYLLCQTAGNLLTGEFVRTVNDFFEPFFEGYDKQNIFDKHSILHEFCEWIVRMNVDNEAEEDDVIEEIRDAYRLREYGASGALWVDRALNQYFGKEKNFLNWIEENTDKKIDEMTNDEVSDWKYQYLETIELGEDIFEDLVMQLSNEMFYILFQNRDFLHNFNSFLATYNNEVKKRITIPQWVQRAVYFRDRGCCVFCGKDLSGFLHVIEEKEIHYDHMVPLAENGINDISNIQLSCNQCNHKKSAKSKTSTVYQQWYNLDP